MQRTAAVANGYLPRDAMRFYDMKHEGRPRPSCVQVGTFSREEQLFVSGFFLQHGLSFLPAVKPNRLTGRNFPHIYVGGQFEYSS